MVHPFIYGENGVLLTMSQVRQRSDERMRMIKKRFCAPRYPISRIVEVWECDINEQIKRNPAMKHFFENEADTSPFMPRETLYGGEIFGGTRKKCFRSNRPILAVCKKR